MYDMDTLLNRRSPLRYGPAFFGIVAFLVAPAMRKWMLSTLGAFLLFLFSIGNHEPDVNAMGAEVYEQKNGYYMTPFTWMALGLLVFMLCLYPVAFKRSRTQVSTFDRIKEAVTRPRRVEVVNAPAPAPAPVQVPPAPTVASAAPDPTKPERPFYVPTYIGGSRSHHSEVAGSGVVINERRTFDREVE